MNHLPGPTEDFKRDPTHDETVAVAALGDRIRTARDEAAHNPPGDKLVWIEVRYDDIADLSRHALRLSMEKLANLGWIVKLHERRFSYWTETGDGDKGLQHTTEKYVELFAIAPATRS